MNDIEKRINKMLKKSEVILQAGKPKPQTNEEWLNSLAWDLKAYWLANTCSRAMWEKKYENNDEKGTLGYWKEWLSQPHTHKE